jgi:hypothetical protein
MLRELVYKLSEPWMDGDAIRKPWFWVSIGIILVLKVMGVI